MGHQFWQKVEDRRKGFNIACTELFSETLVPSSNPRTLRKYNQSSIARQCTVIRRFYRVYLRRRKRKSIEINSESWFDSSRSQSQNRQTMFFTVVNPMDNQDGLGETPCDLSQARIAPYKNTWKHFQDTVFWCNLKLAQQRGLQFYQTRSNAVILYDTLPAEFIEKAICMKDQLEKRESVILRPRVVLKANSQSGSQDLLEQEARSSWESQQDAESYGETRSNTADYRVPGFSISTVKLQDARRQHKATKLIDMFGRSTGSAQQLLVGMNHTEIFELCENSAKLQCPDCSSFTEIWIIHCSCGRNLKYKRSPTTTQKAKCEFSSIPGFGIKSNSSRGPKHGQSVRQIMFFKAKEMLKKARQEKTWQPSDDTLKVARTRRIPKVIGGAQYWRKRNHALRSHRSWKTWFFSYTNWTVTERQTLGSFECCWAPETPSTATRICRCVKTMPENARCSPGGNATIFDTDTSTTSTASTTKSGIRRRKLRFLCRSQHWMSVSQRATGKL